MKSRAKALIFLVVGAGSALLAGCHDPAHEEVVQRHWDSMGRAWGAFKDTEAERPAYLRETAKLARDQNQQDVEQTRENPHIVAREIQGEFDRFHDRQPAYRKEIDNQLRGDPDKIKETLPHVLY